MVFFDRPEDDYEFSREVTKLKTFIAENNLQEPKTFEELLDVKIAKMRHNIQDNPLLNEKVASDDGKAVAIYVPIMDKKIRLSSSSGNRKDHGRALA